MALPPIVLMPVSKAEARAQAGLLKHEDHLLGIEGMAILARIALDVVAELENGADFGAGKIGDGAHVFAGEARGGGKNVRVFLDGHTGVRAFKGCSASHGWPPAVWASVMRSCDAAATRMFSEDFVERRDGGVHVGALQNVRRQEAQDRIAGAVDEDVALEHFGDVSLARSAESSSAAIIRPLPRTSTMALWRLASSRSCCWK
jgi:hypothetical protein